MMNKQPLLSTGQERRLQKFWTRQKGRARDAATKVVRAEMRQVIRTDGTLMDVAAQIAGDVLGMMSATVVAAIRGVPVTTDAPSDGDTLVYSAALDQLVYNATSGLGSGMWVPVTTGDVDSPEIVFDDGDVVMEFVS